MAEQQQHHDGIYYPMAMDMFTIKNGAVTVVAVAVAIVVAVLNGVPFMIKDGAATRSSKHRTRSGASCLLNDCT